MTLRRVLTVFFVVSAQNVYVFLIVVVNK